MLKKENILALILKKRYTSEIIRKCVLMDQNEVPYFCVLREQCDLYVLSEVSFGIQIYIAAKSK